MENSEVNNLDYGPITDYSNKVIPAVSLRKLSVGA